MNPIETREFGVQFTAPLSPWWLLLFVPLAVVAAWAVYRHQLREVSRGHAITLLALRILTVTSLIVLAFRPNLILRTIRTYPGRILLAIDNSESMASPDNAMTDTDALRLARQLRPGERDAIEICHHLAETLSAAEDALRQFETSQKGMDRSRDAFWEQVERAQQTISEQIQQFEKLASAAPRGDAARAGELERLLGAVRSLPQDMKPLFAGDQSPEKQAFHDTYTRIDGIARDLLRMQALADQDQLAQGNQALADAAKDMKTRPRIDLLYEVVSRLKARPPVLHPTQFLLVSPLSSPSPRPLADADFTKPEATQTRSDLVGWLEALVQEESDFPLSAILLCSDGQHLGEKPLDAILPTLARKSVPVSAAAVGSLNEPFDLAVQRVIAPPFAVKDSAIRVRIHAKTVLPSPASVRLQILKGTDTVASKEVILGERAEDRLEIPFAPADLGLFRYTVRLDPAPGEAFPARNNSADFAANVRQEKVNVLLLDWKPRWETRFVLNILQRMDFIDLNAIVGIVQENHEVARGVRKGAWPENLAALEMYHMVVLGDVPSDLLTPAEWNDLKTYVLDKGRTICFIGTGKGDPLPSDLAEALLPVMPRGRESPPAEELKEIENLGLTEAGLYHPITRALRAGAPLVDGTSHPRSRRDSQVLLVDRRNGAPLITCRFTGNGNTAFVDTEWLWKWLNPAHLSAHAEMYIAMLTWAVEGGNTPEKGKREGPWLAVDRRSFVVPAPIQVWAIGAAPGSELVAESGGEIVARTPLPRGESDLPRAVFPNLPPRDVTFRIPHQTEIASPHIILVEDDPELKRLARNEAFLQRIAAASGGEYRDFTDLDRLVRQIPPKQRVDRQETTWRLWDARAVLAFLVVLLTVHWVWRKWIGLV